MITLLFRTQRRKLFGLILLFVCILSFTTMTAGWQFEHRFLDAQTQYLQRMDALNNEDLFKKINSDEERADEIVWAIENFHQYDGDDLLEIIDPMELLTGNIESATYDMIVWREEMLQLPGQYTDTVLNDSLMLHQLAQRFRNQESYVYNIQNSLELAQRGIRRQDSNYPKYVAAEQALRDINPSFEATDPLPVDEMLAYVEEDAFFILLVLLSCCWVFSNEKQQRVANAIAISPLGARRYAVRQIIAVLSSTLLGGLLYYALVFLLFNRGLFTWSPWQLPIQAIVGYEWITYNFSSLEYLLVLVAVKVTFSLCLAAVCMFQSLFSKNNVVSGVQTALLYGLLLLLSKLLLAESEAAALVIGGGQFLFSYFPYWCIGQIAVPYVWAYVAFLVFLTVLFVTATILFSNLIFRKWVRSS